MTQFSIFLALNLAGLALIFLFVRSRVRKALEAEGLQEKLRDEVGQLVRELNQTTDRNITLLEESVRTLKEAIAEADRRAGVLRREAERRSAEGAVYDRLGRIRAASAPESDTRTRPAEPAVPPFRRGPAEETPRAPEAGLEPGAREPSAARPDSGTGSGRAGAEVRDAEPPAVPFVTFSSTPLRSKPPVKEEVLSLNRRGISSEFIAAKLGITVAEVELIVSLEEQRGLASREGGS